MDDKTILLHLITDIDNGRILHIFPTRSSDLLHLPIYGQCSLAGRQSISYSDCESSDVHAPPPWPAGPRLSIIPMKPLLFLTLTLLTGCASLPKNFTPVDDFNVERYLGLWYEIARLDHSFERGLSHVTAQYSWRNDGGIEVINRGYLQEKSAWKEAKGKAYLAGEADQGFLRVSFFGPFYGAYVVCALDRDHYRYALVCGPDTSYLWILARTPTLDEATVSMLVAHAESLGYNTRDLIHVNHQPMGNQP